MNWNIWNDLALEVILGASRQLQTPMAQEVTRQIESYQKARDLLLITLGIWMFRAR